MIREMARSVAESDTVRRRSWELWISTLMCVVTLLILWMGPRTLQPSDFPEGVTPLQNKGQLKAIRTDVEGVKNDVKELKNDVGGVKDDVRDVKAILEKYEPENDGENGGASIPPTWMRRSPPV